MTEDINKAIEFVMNLYQKFPAFFTMPFDNKKKFQFKIAHHKKLLVFNKRFDQAFLDYANRQLLNRARVSEYGPSYEYYRHYDNIENDYKAAKTAYREAIFALRGGKIDLLEAFFRSHPNIAMFVYLIAKDLEEVIEECQLELGIEKNFCPPQSIELAPSDLPHLKAFTASTLEEKKTRPLSYLFKPKERDCELKEVFHQPGRSLCN